MYSGNYTGRELNERFSSESKSCRPGIRRVRELTGLYGTSKNIDEFKWFNMTYPNVYDQLISKLNEDKLHFENTNLKDEKELRAKGVSEANSLTSTSKASLKTQ